MQTENASFVVALNNASDALLALAASPLIILFALIILSILFIKKGF